MVKLTCLKWIDLFYYREKDNIFSTMPLGVNESPSSNMEALNYF